MILMDGLGNLSTRQAMVITHGIDKTQSPKHNSSMWVFHQVPLSLDSSQLAGLVFCSFCGCGHCSESKAATNHR